MGIIELIRKNIRTIPAPKIAPDALDVDRYSVHWCAWRSDESKWSYGVFELDDEVAYERKAIVRQIVDGQFFPDLDRIRCGNEAMSFYRDVTRDIAAEVVMHCIDEGIGIQDDLLNWLHCYYGIHELNDAIVMYPCLDRDA